MVIVREILDSKAITINEEYCQAIALEVMGISYAKGGDYSPEIIKSFAEGYLKIVGIWNYKQPYTFLKMRRIFI